jgi:hypothetical protein
LVRAVLVAAGGEPPDEPGDPGSQDRAACRFLSTLDPRLARVKLDLIRDEYRLVLDADDPRGVVLRKPAPVPDEPPAGWFGFGKKPAPPPPSGLEVVVELPATDGKVGEIVARGGVFGTPPPEFARRADRAVAKLLAAVRLHLGNFDDRRKHPRVPADFPVTVFPFSADGRVGPPAGGRCRDVSAGGLSLVTAAPPPGKYVYVAFEGVPGAAGLAVLLRVLHHRTTGRETVVTGRFDLGLWPGT